MALGSGMPSALSREPAALPRFGNGPSAVVKGVTNAAEVRAVVGVLERHGLDARHVPELSLRIAAILGEERLLLSAVRGRVLTEEEAGNALLARVCMWLEDRDAALSEAFRHSDALAAELIALFAGWK